MARDLAKTETRLRARPQRTFRRETTMPRQATDLPDLGVFASIRRPDTSNADALSKILGLANDVGQKIYGDIQEGKDKEDAADALLDFGTGEKDDERFAKSRAYRDAWQLQGAKQLAIEVSTAATEKFNTRLSDDSDPATIEDMDAIFEETLKEHLIGPDGQPINLITPQAKATLGTALAELKVKLMPAAAKAIAKRQNTRLFETTFRNMSFEREAGRPIGSVDPLAPLPEDPEVEPQTVSFGAPTGRPPLPGAVTSTMRQHEARGSKGVDIDGKMGDPIIAPAGGTVSIGRDKRSGLFVKIDHGGGVVSTYSHLSKTDLKDGDVIPAGGILGLVGNSGHVSHKSGDGSHLHWRVKVKGKDVDPLSFQFQGGGSTVLADGTEPQLKDTPEAAKADLRPGFDVEGFMSSLPPSVNKGEAKAWLLQALVAKAYDEEDPSLLNGLEDSVRKDGFPSFTPEERLQITEKRDQLRERVRIRTERAENKLHQDNADLVIEAFNHDRPPSTAWLNAQADKGLLDVRFVNAMINHIEAERKSELSEARSEARLAQREEDDDLDAMVYAMETERRAGILSGSSYEDDLKRFESGELGTGKKAAARFKRLQAAAKTGREEAERNPQFARYSAELKTRFKPRKVQSGNLLLARPQGDLTEPEYREMVSFYEEKVHSGVTPGEAFREAVKQYAPKAGKKAPADELAIVRAEIAAMKKQRDGR